MKTEEITIFSSYLQQLKDRQIQELNSLQSINNSFPKFHYLLAPNDFWELFLIEYKILNSKEFVVSEESKQFVFTIIFYIFRDQFFKESPLIFQQQKCGISLDKGLLIVGSFGVGKTSILKTIVSLIDKTSLNSAFYPVRIHNTIDIVEEFECSFAHERNDIINKYSKAFRVFDDVKNEREASNFGKVDLFKDILYKRCENRNFRTIILSNYDSQFPNDMKQAIESFERYGDRNYDRLFEAFNFIEFKGTSNRK